MTLKKGYYYLFYKLYKSFEAAPSKWLSEWKASFCMDALIIFILLTIGGYYSIITKKEMITTDNPEIVIWVLGLSVAFINYLFFNHRNKWKLIIEEFDRLPKKKNRIGTLLVWLIIFLIFANLIFMYYLMSQVAWRQ
jgi:hypothetical protein